MVTKTETSEEQKSKFEYAATEQKFQELLTANSEAVEIQRVFDAALGCSEDKIKALDQSFRMCLISSVARGEDHIQPAVRLISLCIEVGGMDLCSPNVPALLLSDLYETLTIDKCEIMFSLVEEHLSTWKSPTYYTACKNTLLRLCNDLLRRLSQSQNTVFCGRILLFLAKFFPFAERSGLNIVSEFNLDNVTTYTKSDTEPSQPTDTDAIDVDDNSRDDHTAMDTTGIVSIDYHLYNKFWQLQEFFRVPTHCYKPKEWKTFTANCTEVLDAFTGYKLSSSSSRERRDSVTMDVETSSDVYFAKYLTNHKLLDLQLSDSNFRRYILLQILILFQYLQSRVKFRLEGQVFTSDQKGYVSKTSERVYKLIKETPPNGEEFAKAVMHILSREDNWNMWKNEGCPGPPFARKLDSDKKEKTEELPPPAKPAAANKYKRKLGNQIRDSIVKKRYHMGNVELTKLWNLSPDNLVSCADGSRNSVPALESFFDEARGQSDPASQVEDEYKKVNDMNFSWRALRLLRMKSTQFFAQNLKFIDKTPAFLEDQMKKIFTNKDTTVVSSTEGDLAMSGETAAETDELGGGEDEEESKPSSKLQKLSMDHVTALAPKIANKWRNIAPKLGMDLDKVEEFGSCCEDETEQAFRMLSYWRESDELACAEELLYSIEAFPNLYKAAQAVLLPDTAQQTQQ